MYASMTPRIVLSKKALKTFDEIRVQWPKRIEKAKLLFLEDVACFLRGRIRAKGVKIDIAGKEKRYAEDLRIGVIESRDEASVAIYMNKKTVIIDSDYAVDKALYFSGKAGSKELVNVLSYYGPWPAYMVPIEIKNSSVGVVARRVRGDELDFLSKRIYDNKKEIISELIHAGAKNPVIGKTKYGIGLESYEDLGYAVLRAEFGFDGRKSRVHWRSAFRDTIKYSKTCMNKVVEYIKTGDDGVFDILEDFDKIGEKEIKDGANFASEIAPFFK